MLPAVIHTQWT